MDIDVVPSPSLMLLDGTIVDVNERTGTITFKEKSDYTIKYAGLTTVDWTYYFYGTNRAQTA